MANKFTQKLDKFLNIYRGKDESDEKIEAKLEEKQGELIQLDSDIQEQETLVRDLRKSYLLDEIKETSYLEAKAELDEMIEKKATIQEDMKLIQQYRQEDAELILDELESYRDKELKKEESKEVKEIKNEVAEAKLAYLTKLSELGKRHKKVNGVQATIDRFSEKLGGKMTSFQGSTYDILGVIHTGRNVTVPVEVDVDEANNALQNGLVDSHLKNYVEGKKKAK
ncbi:hypothetical protein [Pseudalkalibacillus hwajinpoensis]|uniref:hypothetical protein n=1 Tax=Guptibacillus hwajinpoensis TaxID=208199 RepID=UPI001CD68E32|nr:hypothetical protein [Pseudalkalibacillus hwajinpoensis]MCA0992975.1 hypothetical protein [Pseudalkalibacillus hwajinpoensis]